MKTPHKFVGTVSRMSYQDALDTIGVTHLLHCPHCLKNMQELDYQRENDAIVHEISPSDIHIIGITHDNG